MLPPDQDMILEQTISNIWMEFDRDGNGYLTKDELKRFVLQAIQRLGQDPSYITDQDINLAFT